MITIRLADVNDVPAIAALTSALTERRIAPDCTPEGAERLLAAMSPEATLERLAAGCLCFVACDSGTIVGVIVILRYEHLYHLFVASSHQRRGIASELWRVARESCLGYGNPGRFTVNSALGAVGVYESFGFRGEAPVSKDGIVFVPMTFIMTTTPASGGRPSA